MNDTHRGNLGQGRRPRIGVAVLTALLGAALAACSASSSAPASGQQGAAPATARAGCRPPNAAQPVEATPVPGTPSDWNVTSFDGTVIRAHWFPVSLPAGKTAPTVLMGPGWSLAGDTDVQGSGILGAIPIKDLRAAGYNVLTWDPRGFGRSGGKAEVDSPAFEGRDVSTLISWVATLPGVQLDAAADPRMGMVGGSYGGGIQLVTAAIDCRVDAIVPTIAWHSLVTSLDKADTVKTGWSDILTNLTTADHVDPEVARAHQTGDSTGLITDAQRAWFAGRGPGDLVARINVPTLIVQGTVDTLFTLQEGVENYQILRHRGVPTSMVWFCGGHGVCLTPPGDEQLPATATIAWLDRYVKRDASVSTGPGFRFVDQKGADYAAGGWPLSAGQPVTATGQGTLALAAGGGSGPADTSGSGQIIAVVAGGIVPARAANAVNVPVTFGDRSVVVVGAPQLRLVYRGTTPPGPRPTRVFAQLVDESTGIVLGNQITPIDVTLDGQPHTTTVPLEMVAFTGKPQDHVELQLVASTVSYAQPRLGGSVDFTQVQLALPVASGIAAR
ncbi:MAG TPA: CocE/NonD family hydrolase [Acidimicrobiales bacterium]